MSESNNSPPDGIEPANVPVEPQKTQLPPTTEKEKEVGALIAYWEQRLDAAEQISKKLNTELQTAWKNKGGPYTVLT